MKELSLLGLVFIVVACGQDKQRVSKYDFDFDYEIRKYYKDTIDAKNLRHVEYYDSTNKLIRIIGQEVGCTRYIYKENGKLKETIHGRNCLTGSREIMIYDELNDLVGTYRTRDSLINLDTVAFVQTRFYNKDHLVVREFEREVNFEDGKSFEIWNNYFYENGRISKMIIEEGEGTLWTCEYLYDDKARLKAIHRFRNKVYQDKSFTYDDAGRLIEREIKSNEYPLTPEVAFSAGNNKTLYKYDASGNLAQEIRLSHKGRVDSKVLYVRKRRDRLSG